MIKSVVVKAGEGEERGEWETSGGGGGRGVKWRRYNSKTFVSVSCFTYLFVVTCGRSS